MNESFRQTNGFAMQYGVVLGLWYVLCSAIYVVSFVNQFFSSLYLFMFLLTPFLVGLLAVRFRSRVSVGEDFLFMRGFSFTLLMLLYACIWQALAVYVYMTYFDGGYIFDCFLASLQKPEVVAELERSGMMAQINEMTDGGGVEAFVDAIRMIPPATFTAVVIYLNFIIAPILSVLIALVVKKKNKKLV